MNHLYCPSFPTNMKPSLKLMRVGTSHLGSLPSSGHNNQVRCEIPRCRRELVSRSGCWRDGGSTFPYSNSNAWTIRRHWMSRSGSLRAAVESCGVSLILDHRYKDFSSRSLVCFTLSRYSWKREHYTQKERTLVIVVLEGSCFQFHHC